MSSPSTVYAEKKNPRPTWQLHWQESEYMDDCRASGNSSRLARGNSRPCAKDPQISTESVDWSKIKVARRMCPTRRKWVSALCVARCLIRRRERSIRRVGIHPHPEETRPNRDGDQWSCIRPWVARPRVVPLGLRPVRKIIHPRSSPGIYRFPSFPYPAEFYCYRYWFSFI